MGEVLPSGVDWLATGVAGFDPASNSLSTADGRTIKYDYLVVATGMQPKWGKVKGLPDALGDGRVVSNMSFKTAPLTFKAVQALRSGHALFTMPKGVVKCPGAGHKVCYISEDHFRRAGRRGAIDVTLAMAGDKVFGVPRYAATIEKLVAARGINVQLSRNLVEVRGAAQEAVFEVLGPNGQAVGEEVAKYDLLHVTPPQGPLEVVAESQLANEEGWVAVNQEVGVGLGVGVVVGGVREQVCGLTEG
jgi:sulfide:quinone oxidoreductase